MTPEELPTLCETCGKQLAEHTDAEGIYYACPNTTCAQCPDYGKDD